jgi:hypothetical protein
MRVLKVLLSERLYAARVMLWIWLAAMLAVVLFGCATTGPTSPVVVEIPVAVPCQVQVPPAPAWALSNPQLRGAERARKAEAVIEELAQREAYQRELLTVLEACLAR